MFPIPIPEPPQHVIVWGKRLVMQAVLKLNTCSQRPIAALLGSHDHSIVVVGVIHHCVGLSITGVNPNQQNQALLHAQNGTPLLRVCSIVNQNGVAPFYILRTGSFYSVFDKQNKIAPFSVQLKGRIEQSNFVLYLVGESYECREKKITQRSRERSHPIVLLEREHSNYLY